MPSKKKIKKPITATDVAEYAGVSIATVSRVINKSDNVREGMRKKVLEAISILGYQPSRTAQRLRARKSKVIGIIISDIQNPFFTTIVRGIEDVAQKQDYSVILCNSDEDPDKEKLYIDIMQSEDVAGVIIASTSRAGKRIYKLMVSGIPVVAIDRMINKQQVDSVCVDNELGAYEGVSHLIQQGHQRIGYIGLPLILTPGVERQKGYMKALTDHDLLPIAELMKIGNAKQDGGFTCAKELLQSDCPPSALFIANNLMTLGALGAIKSQGLVIPKDISLLGFDDVPWAQFLNPPLSTISQPIYELGKQSIELLLMRIANPSMKTKAIRLKPELIIRESVGPAPD